MTKYGNKVKSVESESNMDFDLSGPKSLYIKGNKKIDSDNDENSARGLLKSERHMHGKADRKMRQQDLLGDDFGEELYSGDEAIANVVDEIDS